MEHRELALMVTLALAAGVFTQGVARVLRVPAIILLLSVGIALGPPGLNWLRPAELGTALFGIVDFAVAIILFEGALNLDLNRLRREERVIRRLVTLGAVVTLIGGALAARYWLEWSWTLAFLFGSLVVVTGPTVVGPLVRELRLRPRLRTILEAEGVVIDPIGALLAVLVLQVTLAADTAGAATEARNLLLRLAVGLSLGVASGFLIAGLLRFTAFVHGLENILTLALVTLSFYLGDHLMSESGLLVVVIAGLVVGNLKSPVDEDLREFKDQLSILLIGAIFVLLAADIGLADVRQLGWRGVGVLATLVLVVRPLGAWLSTGGTGMKGRERVFVAAIAPRGIVAAALASLTAEALAASNIPGGQELRALVFLVIAGTVVIAGATAWPLSAAMGLRLPARDRIAILGAQGLGRALGRALVSRGASVVFVDADPQRCREAESEGLPVVFGDGLQERTLRRLPIELVGTVAGATYNDNLNSQFVRFARQAFGVRVGLVSVDSLDGGQPPEHVKRAGADLLFEGPHDQERWDVRFRQDDATVEPFEFRGEGPAEVAPGKPIKPSSEARQELFVILTSQSGERITPKARSKTPKRGDQSDVAIFTPSREQALGQLAALGWHPVPPSSSPDRVVR